MTSTGTGLSPGTEDHRSDAAAGRWLLSASELGRRTGPEENGADPTGWTSGDAVALIDGEAYFRRLLEQVADLGSEDEVYFADWRADADEQLSLQGPTFAEMLCGLAARGVAVRGLVWRSHSDRLRLNARANQRLATRVNQAGGEVLLDQRIPWFGSHHQKLFVVRHGSRPGRDVAFVGGLDLCHGRRDDPGHHGDPQVAPMDRQYAGRAPWHDVALELRGPVVEHVLGTFVERWNDPAPLDGCTPYRVLLRHQARLRRHAAPIEPFASAVAPAGRQCVQVLRTYGRRRPAYPFAPEGERSIARAYLKAFARARRLIYIEDQYLWSPDVVQGIADAVQRSPQLRVIIVVPRFPDDNRWFKGPPNRVAQVRAIERLRRTDPERVAVYDLENAAGVPIYVHAKVCVIDDVWLACGSANLNRRSWTTDSELTCAVIDSDGDEREPADLTGVGDGARRTARDLRLRLWAEHLGVAVDDPALLDPVSAFALWRRRAEALDAWTENGRSGLRPEGRVRRHEPARVGRWTRLWAEPVHRILFDPDDRWARRRRA